MEIESSSLQQQQQHDSRRFRLDTVALSGRHVDPRSGLGLLHVIAQAHGRLALHEEQHGRFRCRVFRKFLALGEAEDDRLDLVVLVDRAAQDAVRRRLGFLDQIEDVRVGGGHDCSFTGGRRSLQVR